MTTRRSFLKRHLVLGSAVVFAPTLDGLAAVSKSMNAISNTDSLNLLCCSETTKLKDYSQTIKNFELGTINVFAGNISSASEETIYQLGKINYHASNFSLSGKQNVDQEYLASLLTGGITTFVNCNYLINNTRLRRNISPYVIINSGRQRIGITGVGAHTNLEGITVKDPATALNKIAQFLKQTENCDKVICLADLGFNKDDEINNLILAQSSFGVDVVVGAGAHKNNATVWSYRNASGEEVIVSANKDQQHFTNFIQLPINQDKQIFTTKNI